MGQQSKSHHLPFQDREQYSLNSLCPNKELDVGLLFAVRGGGGGIQSWKPAWGYFTHLKKNKKEVNVEETILMEGALPLHNFWAP